MAKSKHRKNHKEKARQYKGKLSKTTVPPRHFGPKETTLASPRAGIQLPGSETDLDRYAF